jgi:cell division septum initiation protein DivIVA
MSEEPQVVSISSSTAVSPDEIARKSFAAVRKGIDGEAVHAYLVKVAAELRDVLEREAVLRERLAEAERRAAEPDLDEATLTRAIGIETAKILSTAHEAAHNVVAKAEERAAELIASSERVLADQVALAEAEALEIRLQAEREADEYGAQAHAEADALTDEAHADAVELLDVTKEECRRMVAEARDLRNRTLADLAARRASLRVQLEELRGGKDSLLSVVDAVGHEVDLLRERLAAAEDQARVAAEEAGERAEPQPGHDELGDLEAELAASASGVADGDLRDQLEAAVSEAGAGEQSPLDETTPVGAQEQALAQAGPSQKGSSASRRSVDELFARIRASRAAEEAAAEPVDEPVPAEGDEHVEAVDRNDASGADGGDGGDGTAVAEPPGGAQGELVAPDIEHTAEIAGVVAGTEPVEAERLEEPDAAVVPESEATAAVEVQPGPPEHVEQDQAAPAALAEAHEGAGEASVAVDEPAPLVESVVEAVVEAVVETAVVIELVPVEPKGLDADAITEPDVESLARRDHLLGAVTAKLGRALKRALQDDQNDLLNALRKSSRKPVLDELVPASVQLERFVAAASDQLARAFEAGAAFLVTGDAVEGPSVSAAPPSEMTAVKAGTALAAELAQDLSGMLRQRIEEALSELDGSMEGSSDAAGIAYREWKGSRVEGLAGDFTTRAFAVGELAVLESVSNGGAPLVRWAVEDDDGGGSCPDCDDNSLAGALAPGVAFPTGHSHPPVHPGCRCLLVPVRS